MNWEEALKQLTARALASRWSLEPPHPEEFASIVRARVAALERVAEATVWKMKCPHGVDTTITCPECIERMLAQVAAEARVAALERVVRRARFKIEHTCEPEETEDPYCVACCVNAAADGRALDAAKEGA